MTHKIKNIFLIFLLVLLYISPALAETGNDRCTLDVIGKDFTVKDGQCWMCDVVVTMTSAFLNAMSKGISLSILLGQTILKYGFALWILYYLLQQVSSTNPTSPGKMLQNILIMGFKVALALVIINSGITFITQYILLPIVGAGTDYGQALLNSGGA